MRKKGAELVFLVKCKSQKHTTNRRSYPHDIISNKSVSTAKKSQEEKENSAVAKLEQFLFERRAARQPVDDLEEFERELHKLVRYG